MQTLDFHALDETEFEEFCLDLLKELGFVNVDWRKGTGLQASPSDRGRDIQADLERADVDGAHYVEKWFVECKHHKRGVPPEKVQGLLAWAHAERPHVALIIASNFLSNPTKDYLRNYEQNNRPPFRIKVWERPTLDGITKGRETFLARYLLSEMRTESEILAAEGELFNRVWYRRHQTLMRIHECRDRDDSTVKTDVPFDSRTPRRRDPWRATHGPRNRGVRRAAGRRVVRQRRSRPVLRCRVGDDPRETVSAPLGSWGRLGQPPELTAEHLVSDGPGGLPRTRRSPQPRHTLLIWPVKQTVRTTVQRTTFRSRANHPEQEPIAPSRRRFVTASVPWPLIGVAVLTLFAALVLPTIAGGTTTTATTTMARRTLLTSAAPHHAAHAPDAAWRWFIAASGLALLILAYQEWRESRVAAALAVAFLAVAAWVWAGANWSFRAGEIILPVGLVLFGVAETLTRRKPRPRPRITQPAQPSMHPPDSAPSGPRSTNQPAEARVEVDVTPEFLAGFFKDRLDVQAQNLATPFIGKWLTVSGPIHNVGAWRGTFSQVTFNRPDSNVSLYMMFRAKTTVDRLSVLKHGDRMTVCGQIAEIDRDRVQLDPCELIDVVLTPVREQLLAAYAAGTAT